jgi:hypothetical protein
MNVVNTRSLRTKEILADPAIKKALVSISPTSRQNQLIRQMCQ